MKQTITSKYEPKSKNVTWIDMSSGSPVLKNFINGMWIPTGGSGEGGAGSSNPTEADVNKVWQVTPVQKGTKTEETVIVPEQTCNMEDDGKATICTLQDVDESFSPGFSGIVILDGNEYSVEWPEEDPNFDINENVRIGYIRTDNVKLADFSHGLTHTIKVVTRETESIYDYNWAPGVKIPIPTAEDEGKILVVTKTEGDNTSIIIPEQSISNGVYFQNSDISKFVVGNEVKYTISQVVGTSFTKTGLIINNQGDVIVELYNLSNSEFGSIILEDGKDGKVLKFYKRGLSIGNPTIKLEYIEQNYEYQLQENSGGSSDVLWPALYKDEFGNEIMATLVPEDVKPGTWCMVCGTNSSSQPVCYPALINKHGYTLYSGISDVSISVSIPFDGVGELLTISGNAM